MKAVRRYEEGLERYRSRQWAEAIAAFADVLAIASGDVPSQIMKEKCETLKANPPGPEWEPISDARTK